MQLFNNLINKFYNAYARKMSWNQVSSTVGFMLIPKHLSKKTEKFKSNLIVSM